MWSLFLCYGPFGILFPDPSNLAGLKFQNLTHNTWRLSKFLLGSSSLPAFVSRLGSFQFSPHRCIFGVSQKFEGFLCRFWDSILSSFPLFQSIQPWILATVITLDLILWFLRPIELWLSTWDLFSTGRFVSNFMVKALQMWILPSVIPMWVIYYCVTNYSKKRVALETTLIYYFTVSLVLKQAQLNWVFWIRVSYKVSTKVLARAGVSSEGLSGKGFTSKLMW